MAEPVRFVTALVPEELVRVIAESDPWTLDRIVDLMLDQGFDATASVFALLAQWRRGPDQEGGDG